MWAQLAETDFATLAAAGGAVGTFIAALAAAVLGYKRGVPGEGKPPMPAAETARRFDRLDHEAAEAGERFDRIAAELAGLRDGVHRLEVEVAKVGARLEGWRP
jgi:hypothetical protein